MTQQAWSGHHADKDKADKDKLRTEIWSLLKEQQATIRDPFGHIPNFVGAEQAAERLAQLTIWQQAKVIKCNPDSPQAPVRLRALQAGKRLYMAVPRLTNARCFVELTAEALQQHDVQLEAGAIARNALTYGRLVSFEEMEPIDLVLVGCVAVTGNGGRTGKGAGFADLELAMLKAFGLVESKTPIATTVHPLQVVEDSRLPMQAHDWPLDWIVTPEKVIETNKSYLQPAGLDWDALRPEQLKKIPILRKLKEQLTSEQPQ
ncbi:5-formyltetrahydrofolate cyclo-ligase [Leptolyngbya sp. FACHB-261]|uniref:5-formyltetrahydrofolate cyclo-ligase n=1 Tax=Leptolyngbya sp. FACHB-261 TaxID=2692806 RepID=UPI0016870953|nr:5-formyltetrahydrofolate cyclo-ligase [Leptolyngbya sp. FACHB-261]MBD2099753.1 5-formyltetrahydrofolate cyclo-ligase [Leptolyngbya sp. FACHB-261]